MNKSSDLRRKFFRDGHRNCCWCGVPVWDPAFETKDSARKRLGAVKNSPKSAKKLRAARATLEHIIPKSRGGQTNKGNCKIACAACNSKRGNPEIPNCFDRFVV